MFILPPNLHEWNNFKNIFETTNQTWKFFTSNIWNHKLPKAYKINQGFIYPLPQPSGLNLVAWKKTLHPPPSPRLGPSFPTRFHFHFQHSLVKGGRCVRKLHSPGEWVFTWTWTPGTNTYDFGVNIGDGFETFFFWEKRGVFSSFMLVFAGVVIAKNGQLCGHSMIFWERLKVPFCKTGMNV